MFSSTTLAIAPMAQKDQLLLLSPTASSSEVPNTGDHVFTIYPSAILDGEVLAQFAITTLHANSVAVIGVNADAMIRASEAFAQTFEDLTGEVVLVETYEPKSSDFRTQLAKVRNLKADILFLPGYLEEVSILIRQAKELGVKARLMTISTAYDDKLFEFVDDAAEGLIVSAPFYNLQSEDSAMTYFVSEFEERYNKKPDVWAAYGYDAMNILYQAIKLSSLENKSSHLAMLSIVPFDGITGKIEFFANGAAKKELKIKIVEDKQFKDYGEN